MASIRLSSALKALIAAPHAQGNAVPAPSLASTTKLFEGLRSSAEQNGLGEATWLTLGSAALVTLNSPETLCQLYSFAASKLDGQDDKARRCATIAAVMREAGLKTISFSGIPRAINNLGALQSHLDSDVASLLSTESTRQPTISNLSMVQTNATQLWESIYAPHSSKLLSKLGRSHPDLPVHILSSHYGPLLSDLPTSASPASPDAVHAKVGRVLTSVVAIACLRAQGGVGPQVTSHVFGLRKAGEERLEGDEALEGAEWLTSEEGAQWVLEQVDRFVEVVGRGQGATFATRAKL
ncbi:uncharacterized protein JCM10292_000474 [Rhodotorula paludigena]|uniref:uncharacterized protein n=1 Tax=Rhodotorula paludigena TaxID=86838 RepID=UPI003173187A